MLVDVSLDVLRRQLEFFQKCGNDVGIGQYVKKMLGIEFLSVQLMCFFRGSLEQLQSLFAEGVGCIDRFARHLGGKSCFLVGVITKAAEEARKTTSATQQRVEGINHALMAHQLTVVVVAYRHGLAF